MNMLLGSDSEDERPNLGNGPKETASIMVKSPYSRLSQLSKLNLLGLTDLSLIASGLKLSKDVDQALKSCEESIQYLKALNMRHA
jgi:hypothetical protein